MGKIYYGDRAPGGSLKHYRTKGSRNGYSKNPNYKVVGQRAKGKWVNGRYVYDQPANNPMYSKSSSQSRGFLSQYSQGAHQRTSDPVRDKINEKAAATKVKLAAARGSQNNWQQQAARAQAGLQSNMQGPRTTPSGMGNDPRYTQQVQSQSKPGAASRIKQKARVAKAAAKGAKNDWQRQANATAGMTNAYNNLMDNKIRTIDVTGQLGIMQNLDRRQKHSQTKGAQNNWQQQANREAAAQSVENKIRNDSSKAAYIPRRHGGDMYVNPSNLEIDTERKPNKTPGANAMRNDPRYNLYDSMKIEEAKRIASAKARANKEKAAKRTSLINKIKDKISSFFKKKKK